MSRWYDPGLSRKLLTADMLAQRELLVIVSSITDWPTHAAHDLESCVSRQHSFGPGTPLPGDTKILQEKKKKV